MNQEVMDEHPRVAEARRTAGEAFASGLYCAESVVLALAHAQGIDNSALPRAATAFCSGMARMNGPCGALAGAVMGLSLSLGRDQPGESVEPVYAATQRLITEFEARFGARACSDLLGCDLNTAAGQAAFREQGLIERCARYTSGAAAIAAAMLADHSASGRDA